LKIASLGPPRAAPSERLGLSSCTVSVCRELYLKQNDTSSQFLNKFSLFWQIFHKPLILQRKKIAFFYNKTPIFRFWAKITQEK